MTAFTLKIIASICMLLDHIGAVFYGSTPELFRWIGRIAFPIYAYMIAQGCKHTKNINKYLFRLGIFALISEIPFDMAFMHYNDVESGLNWGISFLRQTNVFYTLFLGVACVAVYEQLKLKKDAWVALLPILFVPATLLGNFLPESFPIRPLTIATIVMALYTTGALCFAHFLPNAAETDTEISFKKKIIPLIVVVPIIITAGAFKSDYDMFGVGLIFLLYLANPESKIKRAIVMTAGILYHYGFDIVSTYSQYFDDGTVNIYHRLNVFGLFNLLFAIISVILVFFYNGKQGTKAKWAFYAFYPAHIAILATIWFFLIKA